MIQATSTIVKMTMTRITDKMNSTKVQNPRRYGGAHSA